MNNIYDLIEKCVDVNIESGIQPTVVSNTQETEKSNLYNIYDLLPNRENCGILDDKYINKYLHDIPNTTSVKREDFILKLCKDKRVLHIGSNGPFNYILEKTAKKVISIDNEESDNNASNFTKLDITQKNVFEDCYHIRDCDIDIIVASDIIEHLSNPGLFLDNLYFYNCKTLISVPNAFAKSSIDWLARNKENVHKEHVAYYSYNTLKCLVERHCFKIKEFYWYNGQPRIAEGIIFMVEKIK